VKWLKWYLEYSGAGKRKGRALPFVNAARLAGGMGGSSSGGFHVSSKLRNASFDPGHSRLDGYQR